MNNQETIENCLNSLNAFSDLEIIDLNSKDNTVDLCRDFNIKKYNNISNISDIVNENLDLKKWNLIIYGNEMLLNGVEEIKEICESKEKLSFNLKIVYQNTINQELRLWNNPEIKFKNPVCEVAEDQNCLTAKSIIFKSLKIPEQNYLIKKEILNNWKKSDPLNLEVYYYEAINELMLKNYNKFISLSMYYLNQKNTGFSSVMLCYYLAIIHSSILNDWSKSIQLITSCIDYDPTVAEFWCFLGDIYFNLNQKIKAFSFYENALILGKRRKTKNIWSIDISKYKSYPEKMMNIISEDQS